MKPKKKDIMTWINALRSGKYKQARKKLQTKNGYCCFGVACELFIPKNKQHRVRGLLKGFLPCHQDSCPTWLFDIGYTQGHSTSQAINLATLNDLGDIDRYKEPVTSPLSFEQIADVLQAIYIEEVLWT
jgi:hypothetical protein